MTSNSSVFHEIRDLNDSLLLSWLDLYETAFPPNERVLVSSHLAALRRPSREGDEAGEHLLAMLDDEGTLIGMVRYQLSPRAQAGYLWYIAVRPSCRGQGLGSAFYTEILQRMNPRRYRALVFEVEIPELTHTEEQRRLAERRIEFYRRLGARLLDGIHYLQSVGPHQPSTPMHIMVQAIQPLDAAAAYAIARVFFDDAVTVTGPLTLR